MMYRSISISLLFSPIIASLLIALIVMPKAFAVDTYDGNTGQLSIPSIIVDNLKYENVVVTIAGVVSVGTAIPLSDISPSIRPDSFDLKRSELIIPAVIVGDTVYQNIRIVIKDVISVGANSVVSSSGYNGEWHPDTYNIFVADDVSADQKAGQKLMLDTAIKLWGNFGPMEFYVVGADKLSTQKLTNEWCLRRESVNPGNWLSDNRDWCTNRDWFERYRAASAAPPESGGNLEAGLNGMAADGYKFVVSSINWGFTNPIDLGGGNRPPTGVSQTPFHEYWHVITFSHMSNLDPISGLPDGRSSISLPTWFVEGSAVYMAHYALAASLTSGELTENFQDIAVKDQSERSFSFEESMMGWMRYESLKARADYPDYKLDDFTFESAAGAGPAYAMGSWGIAYLLNKVDNQEAILDVLFPNLEKMGWEGAFEFTFGLTMEEFYVDFYEFLDLGREEHLKILPVPTFTPRT